MLHRASTDAAPTVPFRLYFPLLTFSVLGSSFRTPAFLQSRFNSGREEAGHGHGHGHGHGQGQGQV